MRKWWVSLAVITLVFAWGCGTKEKRKVQLKGRRIGIHLLNYKTDQDLVQLAEELPKLKARGVNLIFLEVDYSFDFKSHPELRWGKDFITKQGASQFADICNKLDIRLVPEFQCLGHQSWADTICSLLKNYPELDLTPGAYKGNEGIYCREWDPMNPRVNKIVFALINEIVEAFDSDGIHIGMDEVFLLNDEYAKSTVDKNPADVFAQVVNEFHQYFVKEKGLELFIWGDRLIDGDKNNYGEYESSHNETHGAVDLIPKDVIICDWHYEPMEAYPSVEMFIEKGFRVLPSSFKKPEAVKALIKHSFKIKNPKMLGHLFTTWSKIPPKELGNYKPLITGIETIASGKFFDARMKIVEVNHDGTVVVGLESGQDTLEIKYTTNGFKPGILSGSYKENIVVDGDMTLKAGVFDGNKLMGDILSQDFLIGKSTGKNLILTVSASEKYKMESGSKALVDGVLGSVAYGDGKWMAFEGEDMEAIVDFGKPKKIGRIRFNSHNDRGNWIHHADSVHISVSDNGRAYESWFGAKIPSSDEVVVRTKFKFEKVTTKYIKVRIFHKTIPNGFPGTGTGAWLFLDEIVFD